VLRKSAPRVRGPARAFLESLVAAGDLSLRGWSFEAHDGANLAMRGAREIIDEPHLRGDTRPEPFGQSALDALLDRVAVAARCDYQLDRQACGRHLDRLVAN